MRSFVRSVRIESHNQLVYEVSMKSTRSKALVLKSIATFLVVFAFATGCSSGASPDVDPQDTELVLGRRTYVNSCVSCHGSTGAGGIGNQINTPEILELYPTIDEQIELVTDGRNRMPSFGARLSEEEIQAVVRYSRETLIEAALVEASSEVEAS